MSCSTALRYSCGGVGAGADGDGFAAVVGRAGFGALGGLGGGFGRGARAGFHQLFHARDALGQRGVLFGPLGMAGAHRRQLQRHARLRGPLHVRLGAL